MQVTVRNRGGVAVVTIDNPPVNATSHAVRAGLVEALSAVEADDALVAAVLVCAGRTFVAGADIREFGQPPVAPHLPDVLTLIEASPKPWVAAIHGAALGGGLELAMACSARIAARDASLGLPEVNLGLIPGAGGTVRLPRLVAAELALEVIAGGKPVSAEAARAAGLVDSVVERADLEEAAIALAQHLAGATPAPTLSRPVVGGDVTAVEAAASRLVAKARGQTSVTEAVAAVRRALDLPATEALAAERAAFLALKDDPQSAALRHVFFAERAAPRLDRLKGVEPLPLRHVGVVGGGTMGAGIAAACLLAGLTVTMIERDEDAAHAGQAKTVAILDDSLRRGVIDADAREAMLASFEVSTRMPLLATADLVIEAVFEEIGVKQQVFRDLDAATRPGAVLATNTSYLDVDAIAAVLDQPERAVGLHFFSPAHVMKLVEIVVPAQVSDQVLATAADLARRLKKTAVFAGVCDGFIGNRIMSRYRREAEAMLLEGALPQEIDAAMTDFGFPMGLFAMQDLAGLDIAQARRRAKGEGDHIADPLCAAGRLGRKTGRGWYDYATGKARPDAEVDEMVRAASRARGIERRAFGPDEIMGRILRSMQDEGSAILAEGIAARAGDIDVVMIQGYGFPRWRGGPMFMAGAADRQA